MAEKVTGHFEEKAGKKELVLRLPVADPLLPSKSGKSLHVAGTDNRFDEIEAEIGGKKVKVKVFAVIW